MKGAPKDTEELLATDVAGWAASPLGPGLKDVRDIREVQVLSKILTDLGSQRIPQALDLACHRIREIKAAKSAGGTWEKAEGISLLLGQLGSGAPLPDGALTL